MVKRTARHGILAILASLFMACQILPAYAGDDPAGFIQGLGDKAVLIINDHSLSGDERQAKFVTLFNDSFDVAGIGRYVLGHYWDHATPQQRDDYLTVFRQYIVATYSARFTRYSGQRFHVIDSHDDAGDNMVSSEITGGADGQPTHIDWVVHKISDGYRIEDVVLDKVSMMQAQRAEFTSVIVHADGSIDGLIAALRQKTGKGAQPGSSG